MLPGGGWNREWNEETGAGRSAGRPAPAGASSGPLGAAGRWRRTLATRLLLARRRGRARLRRLRRLPRGLRRRALALELGRTLRRRRWPHHLLLALGRRRRPRELRLALRRRRRAPLELLRRCGLAPELGLLMLRRRHVLVDLLCPRAGPGRRAAPGPLRRRGHLAAAVAAPGLRLPVLRRRGRGPAGVLGRRHVLVGLPRPPAGPGRRAAPGPLRRRGHLAVAGGPQGLRRLPAHRSGLAPCLCLELGTRPRRHARGVPARRGWRRPRAGIRRRPRRLTLVAAGVELGGFGAPLAHELLGDA